MISIRVIYIIATTIAILGLSAIGIADYAQANSKESLNVMSFNIRYNNPDDGPNAWPHRKELVSSLIQFHKADVIGIQEALIGQLSDLEKQLPKYSWFGVGRDDGKKGGEFTAILYRNDKLTMQKQGTFWCSPTPDIPSKGWDADLNRTVTWGRFTLNNGDSFYLFNTHFDHIGQKSREKCAKLLRSRVDSIVNQEPIVITGDFNTVPSNITYRYLTDNKPYKNVINNASKVSELKSYGSRFTSTRFNIAANEAAPIDYIFTSSSIKVVRFGVLSDSFNGRLPSDHYPLLTEIYLP